MVEPDSLVLDLLRTIRDEQREMRADLQDLKQRMTSLELAVSRLHADFAGQSLRIDRIEARLERIERRLDLAPAG